MVTAIARTIPKTNASLARSGFGATSPLLARNRCHGDEAIGRTAIGRMRTHKEVTRKAALLWFQQALGR
jgi:hypothetical protein